MQEDNRALDRLTKSKEAALLDAERTVQMALAKASLVDDLQNKNQELLKQIEICQVCIVSKILYMLVAVINYITCSILYVWLTYQEENKILDKMHRQKVAEVEKLIQTVRELEEAVLAGGAAANAVREYQKKVQEMNVMNIIGETNFFVKDLLELLSLDKKTQLFLNFNPEQDEKKTLEREVARAKVSANRVATVVANEWKDGNDKVMPVKQWLDERRFLQACFVFYMNSLFLRFSYVYLVVCSWSDRKGSFIMEVQKKQHLALICIYVG